MKKLISAIDARHLSETASDQNWEDKIATEIEKAARSELTGLTVTMREPFSKDQVKKLEQYGYKVLAEKSGNIWGLTISW